MITQEYWIIFSFMDYYIPWNIIDNLTVPYDELALTIRRLFFVLGIGQYTVYSLYAVLSFSNALEFVI